MPIAKGKSQKLSMRRRADMRVAPQVTPKRSKPISTEQIAERFCEQMIENLKRNVQENKAPSRLIGVHPVISAIEGKLQSEQPLLAYPAISALNMARIQPDRLF